MTGFRDHLLAMATGQYGTGRAAQPIAPVVDDGDPLELREAVESSTSWSSLSETSRPTVNAGQGRIVAEGTEHVSASDSSMDSVEPQRTLVDTTVLTNTQDVGDRVLPEQDRAAATVESVTPPDAVTSTSEMPLEPTRDAPEFTNFPSYDEARFVSMQSDQVSVAIDEASQIESGDANSIFPDLLAAVDAVQPTGGQRDSSQQVGDAPQADVQAINHGIEIGELSVTVVPPEPTAPAQTKVRGVPVSASAQIRRAGIRRL